MLPKERIDEWISPESNPDEIVPFALSDMVMEKLKVSPSAFKRQQVYFTKHEYSFVYKNARTGFYIQPDVSFDC